MNVSIKQYYREISHDLLSKEEEIELTNKAQAGDQGAREELIKHNLRLVISIAQKHTGKGLELQDLIQEGNLGLMKAIDRFDPEKGNRFSTYATYWIRQKVNRAIENQSRTIRIPNGIFQKTVKVFRAKDKLYAELNREPSIEEIATEVELKPEKVKEILRISYDQNISSLNQLVGEDEETELGHFVSDKNAENPAANFDNQLLRQELEEVLEGLPDRQAEIVRLRYGLKDGKKRTLKEVGEVFGVTKERIRQLQELAFRKLRHPASANQVEKLRVYMTG